jgi:hypothetical protein
MKTSHSACFALVAAGALVAGCGRTPLTTDGELVFDMDGDCNGTVDGCTTDFGCTSATFEGHTYLFCPVHSTWSEALATCKNAGIHLASIGSPEEDDFVFQTANTLSNEKWWMGFNDIAEEGKFVWENGNPVTFTNWEPEQPEPNDSGGNEDCGQINRYFPNNFWNDEPCRLLLYFICETPEPVVLMRCGIHQGLG